MTASLIDLSKVPVPDIIAPVDFELIRAALLNDLSARLATAGIAFDLGSLESEPAVITEEARAYREVLILQRINEAVRAVMLASARGADLENIAADFNLERRTLVAATDDAAAVMEGDAELRYRRQLAPEGYAVAGPADAYRFHAIEADSSIKQALAVKGDDNLVTLVLLSRNGNGAVDGETVAKVHEALSPLTLRPLTDALYTRSATIVEVAISVRIEIGSGPDAAMIRSQAEQAIAAYAAARHAIGLPLHLDGIIGAARKADPVEHVVVNAPLATVDPGAMGAVFVTAVTVEVVRV